MPPLSEGLLLATAARVDENNRAERASNQAAVSLELSEPLSSEDPKPVQASRPEKSSCAAKCVSFAEDGLDTKCGAVVVLLIFVCFCYGVYEVSSIPVQILGGLLNKTCSDNCSFVEGHAVAWWADNLDTEIVQTRQECCDVCNMTLNCAAATFYGSDLLSSHPIRGPINDSANCVLYDSEHAKLVVDMEDLGTLKESGVLDVAICEPPTSGGVNAGRASYTRSKLGDVLGASALIGRFLGIATTTLQAMVLRLTGYRGTSLVMTILSPRQAAMLAKAGAQARADPAWKAVPHDASWTQIVSESSDERLLSVPTGGLPPTWTKAREALGLSVWQGLWSSITKLFLWHWVQPISYFLVLHAYYCFLGDKYPYPSDNDSCDYFGNNRFLAACIEYTPRSISLWVALREALYLAITVVAMYFNPAYLLLELPSITWPSTDLPDMGMYQVGISRRKGDHVVLRHGLDKVKSRTFIGNKSISAGEIAIVKHSYKKYPRDSTGNGGIQGRWLDLVRETDNSNLGVGYSAKDFATPTSEGQLLYPPQGCSPVARMRSVINMHTLEKAALYYLAPHHYVLMCLWRGVYNCNTYTQVCMLPVIATIGALQIVGDYCSSLALFALLHESNPPVALAIGYWITNTGTLVVAVVNCLNQFNQLTLSVVVLAATLFVVTPLQLSGTISGLSVLSSQ